jgi:hypothetical protein
MTDVTKDELVELIKNWVTHDSEIKKYRKIIKKHRENQKIVTTQLINVMKTNEIDCVNITEGKILYTNNTIKSSITKKHLYDSLNQYFKNDNTDIVDNIAKHILETRKVKPVENIKIKNK